MESDKPIAPNVLAFQFMLERIEGEGEDSEPILKILGNTRGLIGVFDGLGGAGSTVYTTPNGSSTGAYKASRFAKRIVESHFDREFSNDDSDLQRFDFAKFATFIKPVLSSEFQSHVDTLDNPPSKIRSAMIRRLPTTMAVSYFEPNLGSTFASHTMWAGDSRSYVLTSARGLQQLTIDDTKAHGDALANLVDDSPLSNYINADIQFHLNYRIATVSAPTIFMAATDGCFGYLVTPIHFEYLLLSELQRANNIDEWKVNLSRRYQQSAGDDVSLSLAAVGWNDFDALKINFEERTRYIESIIQPVDEIERKLNDLRTQLSQLEIQKRELTAQRKQMVDLLWHEYKHQYEDYLDQHSVSL